MTDQSTLRAPQVAAAEQLWNMRCDCEHPDQSDWGWYAITQHYPGIAQEYVDLARIILVAALADHDYRVNVGGLRLLLQERRP